MDRLSGDLPLTSGINDSRLERAGRRCLAPARFICSLRGLFLGSLYGVAYVLAGPKRMASLRIRKILLWSGSSVPLTAFFGIALCRIGHSRNADYQLYQAVITNPEWKSGSGLLVATALGPLRAGKVASATPQGLRLTELNGQDLGKLAAAMGSDPLAFTEVEVVEATPSPENVDALLKIVRQVDRGCRVDLRKTDLSTLSPRRERDLINETPGSLLFHPNAGYSSEFIEALRDPAYRRATDHDRRTVDASFQPIPPPPYSFLKAALGPVRATLAVSVCGDQHKPALSRLSGDELIALRDHLRVTAVELRPKFSYLSFKEDSLTERQLSALLDILTYVNNSLTVLNLRRLDLRGLSREQSRSLYDELEGLHALERLMLGPHAATQPDDLVKLAKCASLRSLELDRINLDRLDVLQPLLPQLTRVTLFDCRWSGDVVMEGVQLGRLVRRVKARSTKLTIEVRGCSIEFAAALAAGFFDLQPEEVDWTRPPIEDTSEDNCKGVEDTVPEDEDFESATPPSEEFKQKLKEVLSDPPSSLIDSKETKTYFELRDDRLTVGPPPSDCSLEKSISNRGKKHQITGNIIISGMYGPSFLSKSTKRASQNL